MTAVILWAVGMALGSSIPPSPDSFARRVELAALDVARGRISPPDRFEVETVRFNGGAPPPAQPAYRLELAQADGPNASGMIRVKFRVVVAGLPRGDARAMVRGRVRGPALVGTRALLRGSPIDPGGVAVVDTDLTRLTDTPIRDPEQVWGMVPLRTLGEGRVLTPDLLKPEPLVRAGDAVDLFFEKDRLSVRIVGLAQGTGSVGEIVRVENTESGATLLGEVQADGSLLVRRVTSRGRPRP